MKKLIDNYRESINPPYRGRDFFIVGLTLFLLLSLPLTVISILNIRDPGSRAAPPDHIQARRVVQEAVPDEILLKFKPGVRKDIQDRILSEHKLSVKEEITQIEIKILRVAPQNRDRVIESLSKNPLVEFAEVNAIVSPEEIPNDPWYANAWHLPKIKAPNAWDSTKAAGVLVAVCDTGVASVPDLTPVLRGDLGYNTADGTTDWSPVMGHGTLVAGAAAAATNNALGVSGVAWGAKIIPVRITNSSDGMAYVSNAAKCITYAADKGARAINLSYGMAGYSTIDSAGKYAQGKGAVTTVAAGNDGTDRGWPNYSGVLAVAATNSSDGRPSWSNYGQYIDVSAPGVSIMTTTADGAYSNVSGTSLAAPVAAGVAALLFGANPALSATQAESILLNNSDDLGASGWDPYYGYGRVNAFKAVQSALGGSNPTPDTQAPTVSIISPTSGATISGEVVVDVNATDNVGVTKIDFLVDGIVRGTDTTIPYAFSWNSTTVTNGSHSLSAAAYDAAGNTASDTIGITVSNGDTTPPSAPTNLRATAPAYNRVDLTWNPSTDNVGIKGYWIVRNNTTIASVGAVTSYSDTTVAAATTYNYNIIAFDTSDNISTASNTATITTPNPPDSQAPTTPTNLTATAVSSSQINLTWNPSTDNVGVVGYDIYRNNSFLTTVTTTSFGNTNLSSATTYSYTVRAKDAAGNISNHSNIATATTFQPTITTGSLVGTVYSDRGGAISGATVEINLDKGNKISTKTTSVGNYSFSNLPSGTWTVNVSASSHQKASAQVNISVGSTTTQDFTLRRQGR